MSVHVFLGPTVPIAEARDILPAVYHPPVMMGDVYRVGRGEPGVMLIVDGFFQQVPSVRHKEILYAMARGWVVAGCSSMGALRAAELHPMGMVGLGRVFQDYRDGVLEDDDEVAVSHASAEFGHRKLSEAMVDIRSALGAGVDRGVLSADLAAHLTRIAKGAFYPDRHWAGLLERARHEGHDLGDAGELLAFLRRPELGAKRTDALAALARIAGGELRDRVGTRSGFRATNSWQQLVAACEPRGEDTAA
ncbi:MAG: hypothetical protein LBV60_16400 [Streptomyces sp.]|jgi:hypothetical protein|nr:hypothetical protein [Streptomyces sp.]